MSNNLISSTLNKSWNGIFYESAQEVLETMFFSSVFGPAEPLFSPSSDIREQIITAELRFSGTPSGRLQVSLNEAAARSIACNFLGEDRPELVSKSDMEQVLGELSNMVCGSVLSRMDAQAVFSLSHPELKTIESPTQLHPAVVASFELADGVMTSQIFFDSAPTMGSIDGKE